MKVEYSDDRLARLKFENETVEHFEKMKLRRTR